MPSAGNIINVHETLALSLSHCFQEFRLSKKSIATESTPSRVPKRFSWLLPLAVFMGLIAVRLPFLPVTLTGEEGMLAYLAVDTGRDILPKLIVARVDGKDIMSGPNHPIPPYLVLVRVMRPLSSGVNYDALSLGGKSILARLPFFAFSCIGLLSLALLGAWLFRCGRLEDLILPLGAIAFIGSSAPLVWGSVQPQLDGGWGVMLVGLSALCLFAAGKSMGTWRSIAFAYLSGAIAAMGKNEWTMAFAAAAVGAMLVAVVLRRMRRDQFQNVLKPSLYLVLGAIVGILCGTLVSIWLDKANFFGGFNVMYRFTLNPSCSWLEAFGVRSQRVWHLFPLVLVSIWAFLSNPKAFIFHKTSFLILLLWGLLLCGGYMATAWGPHHDRYLCPGFFALLCFITAGLKAARIPRMTSRVLAVFFLAGISFNIVSLFHQQHTISVPRERTIYRQLAQCEKRGKPEVVGAAFGYYFPRADFISNSLGEAYAQKLLKRHGK